MLGKSGGQEVKNINRKLYIYIPSTYCQRNTWMHKLMIILLDKVFKSLTLIIYVGAKTAATKQTLWIICEMVGCMIHCCFAPMSFSTSVWCSFSTLLKSTNMSLIICYMLNINSLIDGEMVVVDSQIMTPYNSPNQLNFWLARYISTN